MSVIVVATISPKSGQEDEVKGILFEAIPKFHAEPGCETYALHDAPTGTDLTIIERWASQEAFDAHCQTVDFLELTTALTPLVAGPVDIRVLSSVAAGDTGKGTL